jgi:CheY-like chemotaxis protein
MAHSLEPGTVGLRVLLAEDDPMVARSTSAVLRRLGHSVIHACDGTSAWKHLQACMDDFDVLVLDVVMPRMGGSELAHRARAAGFSGPIILMSGLVMHMEPDALALLGVRRLLTKPFLPADLERAIRGG